MAACRSRLLVLPSSSATLPPHTLISGRSRGGAPVMGAPLSFTLTGSGAAFVTLIVTGDAWWLVVWLVGERGWAGAYEACREEAKLQPFVAAASRCLVCCLLSSPPPSKKSSQWLLLWHMSKSIWALACLVNLKLRKE